jgi:hypothetical protein
MKKTLWFVCIAFIFNYVNAQSSFTDRKVVLKFDVILPTIALETRFTGYNTFLVEYMPGFVFIHSINEPTKTVIVNQFKGSVRHFYDIDTRIQDNKRTDKFAGSFLSITAQGALESSATRGNITFGPTWGIQRNWGGLIHFSFEIGYGFTITDPKRNSNFGVIGNLNLGFAL